MNVGVAIIGEGGLAGLVSKEMSSLCQVVRLNDFKEEVPESVDFALVLHDAWHPSVHREAEEMFRAAGIPWLRGFVTFGEGVIGPLVRPGVSGCSHCADTRHLMAGRDRKEMWMLEQRLTEAGGIPHDAWASRTGLLQMTHLLVKESQKVIQGKRSQLEELMFFLDLKTLTGKTHFFLPDPLCPTCSYLIEDTPERASILLQPSPKINRKSYRSRSLEDLAGFLVKDYLDYKTGFLNGKMVDLVSPFADVSVNLPMFDQDEPTAGRTHSYAESELTAIMEGLERYCGMAPRGKMPVIHDSYRNLANHALDPSAVGLYAKEQYEQPHFPFKPFHSEEPIDWVWGYSFERQSPILVPQQLAYYSSPCGHGFIYETSNGCALGGSMEEAIFYGIMEVVERDSFLMTWYAQLPLPRLDVHSTGDSELELMINRLRTVAGFDVYLYNATMENGIPSVWALAKNMKPKGVNLICAAGAHPDPVRAAKSAVHELSGMMLTLDGKFEENRERNVQMFHDPWLVRSMEDHSMLYSLREAEDRLQFLLEDNRPLRTFQEEFKQAPEHTDLTDDLKAALQSFHRLKLDVIVVDQTTPELKRNNLYCVKVLIPGMLPMTFGHHLMRVTGLDRVLKVPALLGYVKQPLLLEQLNPHPHPFP
ncbi:TOMM precursor leader peptide-binding protein [Paenibacillus sp. UNC451MF]|uniref:TOMM precursor leader peptide-binding protein n=1 Tax=Paenibacillus sp. UNC451MF TaxID=1449063 RepID=UPI00048E46B6|nr:TOMM precursor leader peptide-binding protein [Paenibacillus sp. UNC451MF]